MTDLLLWSYLTVVWSVAVPTPNDKTEIEDITSLQGVTVTKYDGPL
jgi:hypothetical protein